MATLPNRKSRRASVSKKPAAKKARATAHTELPKFNVKQKARLGKIFEQLRNMQSEHSDSIAHTRAKHAQMEQQITEYKKEMSRTASSMLESVGLDPADPNFTYNIDPNTGIIGQEPRPQIALPAPPSNGAAAD